MKSKTKWLIPLRNLKPLNNQKIMYYRMITKKKITLKASLKCKRWIQCKICHLKQINFPIPVKFLVFYHNHLEVIGILGIIKKEIDYYRSADQQLNWFNQAFNNQIIYKLLHKRYKMTITSINIDKAQMNQNLKNNHLDKLKNRK